MGRSWIVVVAAFAGCTAANPAFGDDTGSSGKADDGTKSTSDSMPSTSTSNTSESAETGTTGDSASMTSDDMSETTDPTIEPATTENPTDDTDPTATSDVTGTTDHRVVLYAATLDDGEIIDGQRVEIDLAGEQLCLAREAELGVDACDGIHRALLRSEGPPFATPEVLANLMHPVVSIDGEPIAETLQAFTNGEWQVPTLDSIEAGNLGDLGGGPLVTGGLTNIDFNCAGWTTTNGDVTLGLVSGGEGWFADGGTQGCSSSAHILCLCLPS